MKNDVYVYDKVKMLVDYLDKRPESFDNLIPHVENLHKLKKSTLRNDDESLLEYTMSKGWEFMSAALPAIGSVGLNFVGSGTIKTMFELYAHYSFDKNKLKEGFLTNGCIEQLCKLNPQKTLRLFDLAEAAGIVKQSQREVFLKSFEFFKDLNNEELENVSDFFVDYIKQRELYGKTSNKLLESRVVLLSSISSCIKSPEKVTKFQELVKLTLEMNQRDKPPGSLILSPNVISCAVDVSPQIGGAMKHSKKIKKLLDIYIDYNMALEIKNEFIDASKDMLKDSALVKEEELAILQSLKEKNPKQNITVRKKIYKDTLDLIQSIAPEIKELNLKLGRDREIFKEAVSELLKENQSLEAVKKIKNYDLKADEIIDFIEKVTSPKGIAAISRYLESPSKINFIRVVTDAHLIKWSAGRVVAACKHSKPISMLKNKLGDKNRAVKSKLTSMAKNIKQRAK